MAPAGLDHVDPASAGPAAPARRQARRPAARRPDEAIEVLRHRIDEFSKRAQEVVDEYVPPEIQKEAHRKGFHMVAGIVATPLVLYAGLLYTTAAALATLVVIAALELFQGRFRVAVPILTRELLSTRRPGERFSWASTMFIVAALAILWLTPLPVAFAGLAMLGLGDGMSALVGKWIGRYKLPYNPKKSWEGTLAGFLAGAIGAMFLTYWYYDATMQVWPALAVVPICIAGALAASIAESIPQWEDNFSVPLASSGTMLILWLTAGLSPRFGPLVEWIATGRWVFP